MGKPLLTDDIIEQAKREKWLEQEEGIEDIRSSHREPIYKSRRIENKKRSTFQSKLNKILVILVFLIILLVWAIFKL